MSLIFFFFPFSCVHVQCVGLSRAKVSSRNGDGLTEVLVSRHVRSPEPPSLEQSKELKLSVI